jgi:hypothetical protein
VAEGLYDVDFVLWTEEQADRLRRMRRGERVNDLDLEHVIEEIEDLGRSEFDAFESNLTIALVHLLKAAAWPASRDLGHWLSEAAGALRTARRKFAPSMLRRFDLAEAYGAARARVLLLGEMDGVAPLPLPEGCAAGLEDFIGEGVDVRALPGRLSRAAPEIP